MPAKSRQRPTKAIDDDANANTAVDRKEHNAINNNISRVGCKQGCSQGGPGVPVTPPFVSLS